MRPLVIIFGFFLRLVLTNDLWGCEPSCPSKLPGNPPIVLEKPQLDFSNFLIADYDGKTSPVPLTVLLGELVEENSTLGIMILESGSETKVQWSLSTSAHTMVISGLPSSKTSINGMHKIGDAFYSIDANDYTGTVRGMVVGSPRAYISFRIYQPPTEDCSTDSLLFAVILWTPEVEAHFQKDITFTTPSDCPFCKQLLLSNKYIKVCPKQMVKSTTTESTFNPTSTVIPTVLATTLESTTSEEIIVTTTASATTQKTTTLPETTTSFKHPPSIETTTKEDASQKTTITSTTTTLAPDTTETTRKVQVLFRNDLRGLRLRLPDGAPTGLVNCSDIVSDLSSLGGENILCNGDGREVDVNFGLNPSLIPGDPLTVKTISGHERIVVKRAEIPTKPVFVVDYIDRVMRCEELLKFSVRQVAGTGNRLALFKWRLISGPEIINAIGESSDRRELTIPTKIIQTNVTIAVNVCNFVGECTDSGDLFVDINDDEGVLTTTISGVADIVHPSTSVRLYASAKFYGCNTSVIPREAQFYWNVSGSLDTGTLFRILPYSFEANDTVTANLYTTYREPKTSKLYIAEAAVEIKYIAEAISLSVDATRRTHPFSAALSVDASGSHDPNGLNVILTHTWSCLNLTTKEPCFLPSEIKLNSAVLQLPPYTLPPSHFYRFTDFISSPLGQNGSVSARVDVAPSQRPCVTMIPLESPNQSVREYIRLIALVSSDSVPTDVQWESVQTKGFGYFNVEEFGMKKSTTFEVVSAGRKMMVSLTIPPKDPTLFPNWRGLTPNSRYLVRVTATNAQGSSTADVIVTTEAELPVGVLEVVPLSNLTGLNTDITLRLGDGWGSSDSSVTYRFGYKVLMMNENESLAEWLPRSSTSSAAVVLPSGSSKRAGCKNRVGFKGLVETCDKAGSCQITESPSFEMNSPGNISVSVNDAMAKVGTDLANGNVFEAMQKIRTIDMELCENEMDPAMADKITLALVHSLSQQSEIFEWHDAIQALADMLQFVSDEVILEVQPILSKYRAKLGLDAVYSRRKRASVAEALASGAQIRTEQEASYLLGICDVFIARGNPVNQVIMENIDDFTAGFCLQLDGQSPRIMKAGNNFTYIQSQSLIPSSDNFLNSSFTTAGGVALIAFTSSFQATFKEWTCGNQLLCSHVCLATAKLTTSAFLLNQPLVDYFYENTPVDVNNSASAMHKVSLLDPSTGKAVPLILFDVQGITLYEIAIPLEHYRPTEYYACYIYTKETGWDSSACSTSNFATKANNKDYMICECSSVGFLVVFTVPPPIPPLLPPHNEVRFSFTLNTTVSPKTQDLLTMVERLAEQSGIVGRIVDWRDDKDNNSNVVVVMTVRPPFKLDQATNSYAAQAILRATDPESGFVPYNGVTVKYATFSTIQRQLVGDGNARKMVVRIDKSFAQYVGNQSDTLAVKWTDSIASALRVSPLRFKNANIFMGLIFNFTITKPFDKERGPLSAEEISLMILECSHYNELEVIGKNGEIIQIPPLYIDKDVVELRVIQESNPLVVCLIVVISTVVLITLLYIGGAVAVKVRTDRFLEEERRRMIMMEPRNTASLPNYGDAITDSHVIRTRHR